MLERRWRNSDKSSSKSVHKSKVAGYFDPGGPAIVARATSSVRKFLGRWRKPNISWISHRSVQKLRRYGVPNFRDPSIMWPWWLEQQAKIRSGEIPAGTPGSSSLFLRRTIAATFSTDFQSARLAACARQPGLPRGTRSVLGATRHPKFFRRSAQLAAFTIPMTPETSVLDSYPQILQISNFLKAI